MGGLCCFRLILLDSGNLVRTSSLGITSLSKEEAFDMELPGHTGPSVHAEAAGSSKVSLVHPWKTRVDAGQWTGRRAPPPAEWYLHLGFKTAVFSGNVFNSSKKISEQIAAPLNVFTFLEISFNFQLSS